MVKDKKKMCNWEENDVFSLPINSDKYPEYNGRYFIFIHKIIEDKIFKNSRVKKLFYVKITSDNHIPITKEEINALEYVKGLNEIFNVSNLWNPKGTEKLIPDKYGMIYVYLMCAVAYKYKIPENLIYIGNYNIEPPKNEYIPKSLLSLNWYDWESGFGELIQDRLIEDYENNNLRKAYVFSKEYQDNIKANEQYHIMGINRIKETRKRLEEDPMGTLKEMGIDIEKELKNPKNNHETYVGGDKKSAMNKKS